MRQFFTLAILVSSLSSLCFAQAPPKVAVVIGPAADELEHYAAEQLCDYLSNLFKVETRPVTALPKSAEIYLLVGSPGTNPAVAEALGKTTWPRVSDQGLVLKPATLDGKKALIISGGSTKATLWAVYELVERWGVRYLLHGDVLPEMSRAFQLPERDVVLEPNLTVRQWRVVNEHAMGPVSWGLDDYRRLVDQLAKLKFNRLFAYIWPLQPFVHYEVAGIRRTSAEMFFGFHFPITDDMPGRKVFGDQQEFWNPDFPRAAGYDQMRAAGEKHLHGLLEYARLRGMKCMTVANLGEFPPEFAPLLKGAQKTIGTGAVTIVPGTDADPLDHDLTSLAESLLAATVNTYPEIDFIELGMQEHRQWADRYEAAWKALDSRYGLEKARPLAEVLKCASRRTGYPGGAERALKEVKGDIVALYFYDRLINERGVLKKSKRPDVRIVYDGVAEELFPVLPLLLPAGSETLNFVDYTPSRILKRRDVLKNIPARQVPSTLIYTLHDDNVGVLPQLATGSLHELTKDLRQHGWAGFSTRYWLISDHDPCVAYLAQAAWDTETTPEAIYRDQIAATCGTECVEEMLTVFREVEAATVDLEWHGLGLTFTVPSMMMQHWSPGDLSVELLGVRDHYQKALESAKTASSKTTNEKKPAVEYWIGRLEFGIGYLDSIREVRRAATAEKAGRPVDALKHTEAALALVRRSMDAFAEVARDQSDRGSLATMGEFVYRPLRDQLAKLKAQSQQR